MPSVHYCSAKACEGSRGFSRSKKSIYLFNIRSSSNERDGGHGLELVGDSWLTGSIPSSVGDAWTRSEAIISTKHKCLQES